MVSGGCGPRLIEEWKKQGWGGGVVTREGRRGDEMSCSWLHRGKQFGRYALRAALQPSAERKAPAERLAIGPA